MTIYTLWNSWSYDARIPQKGHFYRDFARKRTFPALEFELMTFWLVSSCIAFLTVICISPIVIMLLLMSRCLANSDFWPYLMIGSKFSSYIMMASKFGTNEEPPHSSLKWKSCASRSLFRSSSNRLDHRKTCFNLACDYGEWITQSSLSPKTACKCESVSAREKEKRECGRRRKRREREREKMWPKEAAKSNQHCFLWKSPKIGFQRNVSKMFWRNFKF